MPTPHHLRKAPITEAVIDFRVKARQAFEPQAFEPLRLVLQDRFPKVEARRGGQVSFQLAPSGIQPAAYEDLGFQGYFFRSEDEKLLAQFRPDGFTVNRLKPYTSWEELSPVAIDLWKLYCSRAAPEVVVRVALRYINRIPLPPDLGEFRRYLRAAPELPSELPQKVSGFLTRATIHDSDRGLSAHIGQALETDAATQGAALILDIDAFRDGSWPPPDPRILETLRQLHEFKNLIFFNLLTDEALRQFE